ncbi:hypothetical protein EDB84DRAFT_1435760 [Lactarius hengduanensis]|nr:hypothetical protein EDB84DRAFT_1435760 [Lactarius hengduanensis]
MPTFDIPTGPSITERGHDYLVSDAKVRRRKHAIMKPLYGSITYDRKKGEMSLEWANEDEFRTWLAAEEDKNTIKFILSRTEQSNSPNWRARREYKCLREFSGRKTERENTNPRDRKIPSMKTGCRCLLSVKLYPHTETIPGKYKAQHDHALGKDNLRFLRLSDNIKKLVMEMVYTGMGSQAIPTAMV